MALINFFSQIFVGICSLSLEFHVEEVEGHSLCESCASRLTLQELVVSLPGQPVQAYLGRFSKVGQLYERMVEK